MVETTLKFIVDRSLKPLAKRLRMLGFDTLYSGGSSLSEIIQTSILDKRILLTMKPLSPTRKLTVFRLDGDDPDSQLQQLLEAYPLQEHAVFFLRCLICNAELSAVADCADLSLPESVRERKLPIFRCPECQRLYWHGSHLERMKAQLERCGIKLNKP
ncbi:hypothetical protein HQ587_11475 [bacterium]|nr:hypothetical protein [bacterium]